MTKKFAHAVEFQQWFIAKQAIWLLITLLSLAGFGWYYTHAFQHAKIKFDKRAWATSSDTIITHLAVQQFNPEGKLIHYLRTPYMQHFPSNKTHILKKPQIIVMEKDQAPWEINAEEATALEGGKQITFNRNVIVHQAKDEKSEETTLLTEEITYFPESKFATTLKEVTLNQTNNQVKSTGMKAYLAENRVQLLSNARGHYEPNQG